MNCIRDNNITISPMNWEFYKIFVNLDKNKLPNLVKYVQEHEKTERNNYFKKEFEFAFTSFQSFLCWKN